MYADKFLKAQAQEIRRMAIGGYSSKEIQAKLRITKKQLIEILDLNYTKITKDRILDILQFSVKEEKKETKNNKEIIVIDSSFLITSQLDAVEEFLAITRNVVIPGPAIEELPTDSKDEKINCHSRRICTILFELDIPVVMSDKVTDLDPTWKKDKDYYILVVCSKLKAEGYAVKLLSFDKKMILKARGIGVERYEIEFPQENVKHCKTYLEKNNILDTQSITSECKQDEAVISNEIASQESLQALRDKFSSQRTKIIKQAPVLRSNAPVYNFEKPKSHSSLSFDETKLELSVVGENIRLIDNSSIDIFMGIIKTVITSNGKFKDLCNDDTSLYYNVELSDIIIVFTKVSNQSIEMKICQVDKQFNIAINETIILQEGGMKKINKKYHESIKEAIIKLLKIKLKKVA